MRWTSTAGTITARHILPKCAPAFDANGKLVAYEYHGWQHGLTVTSSVLDIALQKAASSARALGLDHRQSDEHRLR